MRPQWLSCRIQRALCRQNPTQAFASWTPCTPRPRTPTRKGSKGQNIDPKRARSSLVACNSMISKVVRRCWSRAICTGLSSLNSPCSQEQTESRDIGLCCWPHARNVPHPCSPCPWSKGQSKSRAAHCLQNFLH